MVEMKVFNNVVEKQTHKEIPFNVQWYFTIIRFYDYFQEVAV